MLAEDAHVAIVGVDMDRAMPPPHDNTRLIPFLGDRQQYGT